MASANHDNTPPRTPAGAQEEEPAQDKQVHDHVVESGQCCLMAARGLEPLMSITALPDSRPQDKATQTPPIEAVTDLLAPRLLTHALVDIYVGAEGIAYALHEKLVCHHSTVLREHFYSKDTTNTSYGLPDDDPSSFNLLVGWLYSRTLSFPVNEHEIGPLLDLYLLAEKLGMAGLERDCVDTVRAFYHANEIYPELRRVQYVYANTGNDNPLREMMVGSVARYLTLGEHIPTHWDRALRRNGQLAVDIIRAIQQWHLESRSVPDVRDGSVRGFSKIGDDTESELDLEYSRLGESQFTGMTESVDE